MLMCWSFEKWSSFILAAGDVLSCISIVCGIIRNVFFLPVNLVNILWEVNPLFLSCFFRLEYFNLFFHH